MMISKTFLTILFITVILSPVLLFSHSSGENPWREPCQTTVLSEEWRIQSSAVCQAEGALISRNDFNTKGWFKTDVPSTVLAALVRCGEYKNIYFGRNLESVPMDRFKHSWWWRKMFNIGKSGASAPSVRLIFEGINYRANVWLNGRKIASSEQMAGCFRMFDFDITSHVKPTGNCLAVEVIPPMGDELTFGFVDWNQWPPDNNLGIWREVKLKTSGKTSLEHPYIQTKVSLKTLDEAFITISADITNHTSSECSGILKVEIEDITAELPYRLGGGERKKMAFTPKTHQALHLKQPRLWWPNNLGKQELYTARLSLLENSEVSDRRTIRFGVREVSDYINEEGHRGYKVNGKKVLIKGAAWVDDMLLGDDRRRVISQMRYVRHLNLNCIRLEGFWGNSSLLYDLADEYGILIMAGLSCHWEWNDYCGRPDDQFISIRTPEDIELHAAGYRDQVIWLRNHPSVFLWVFGSDKLPRPEFERKLNSCLAEYDPDRPFLGACKYKVYDDIKDLKMEDSFSFQNSEISGPTRVKMLGPYDFVAPEYWFRDRLFGGAYGFNTETGPGAQPPTLESIREMIPGDKLWPINEEWDYHCARREFATLKRYLKAFNSRYGAANSVESFTQMAQAANYEAIRPMFEAFTVNKHNATGVIHWMLNSAWPKMVWQLYDYFLRPTGAFYGARKACQPLNLVYNYHDNAVYIVNDLFSDFTDLRAHIQILNIDGKQLYSNVVQVSIKENSSGKVLDIPALNGLSTTWFLSLKLENITCQLVSDNFYWLSTKRDVSDVQKTLWFYTPLLEYANFTALSRMPGATVKAQHTFKKNGELYIARITLENLSPSVAFFIEMKIIRDKTGSSVAPVFWDDNYISLTPGEKRIYNAEFSHEDLMGEKPVFVFSGVNVK